MVNRTTQIAIGSLVLAVILIGAVWLRAQSTPKVSPPATTSEATTSPLLLEGGNAINVSDQEPGDFIIIDLAVFENGGYVVIHEATVDGKPGKVIGNSSFLKADQHEDFDVDLSQEARVGDVLFAMLHGDDGDGEYGPKDEAAPLKDESDNVIQMKFEIIAEETSPEE